jgi:hypothetical protein
VHPGGAGGGASARAVESDRTHARAADLGEAELDALAPKEDEAGALGRAAGARGGALGLGSERPSLEVTIGAIMSATSLSRKSFYQLVGEPDPDLEATADTLLTIWRRTLYGADAPDPPAVR